MTRRGTTSKSSKAPRAASKKAPSRSKKEAAAGSKVTSARSPASERKARTPPEKAALRRRPPAKERARAEKIWELLTELYPDAHCELDFETPFELAVATVLSAQCTDKRVNMVTPALFARFPDAETMAIADVAELEELVRTTGFFRNKAKNILGLAQGVVERHGGEVPKDMDALLALPGVARKTANCILSNAYGLSEGVVVDTHVLRISSLLRLTRQKDAKKVEEDLCWRFPQESWPLLSHRMIWHGRRVCIARRPRCDECPLLPYCPGSPAA